MKMTWICMIICLLKFVSTEDYETPDISYDLKEGYEQIYQETIKGPVSYDDNILIVGAGPSGIHMAYLLKQKGYKNIEIYEKSNRLGGKSKSTNYRGAVHDMGTVYISPDYETNVLTLIKKFTNDTLIKPPMASVWSQYSKDGIALKQYILTSLKIKYPKKNVNELKQLFLNQIRVYIGLHMKYFGSYVGELMSEPGENVKSKISGTFMEFLKRHDLQDLKDLFTACFTLQGYGYLDEIPALYGLMWNTPKLMTTIVKYLNGEDAGLYILSNGFENLWKSIVKSSDIKITYDAYIRYIHVDDNALDSHGDGNRIHMYYKIKNGNLKIKSVDFLIWSPPASQIMHLIGGKRMSYEKQMFSRLIHSYYTTSLVDSINTKRSESPVDWWYNNINSKIDGSVWASRDSYSALHNIYGNAYKQGKTKTALDENHAKRTSVFYQYSNKKPSEIEIELQLMKHLNENNAKDIKIKEQNIWPYFERFNVEDTEKGNLWRILERQGDHKIWFIGSSVCYESVKSVIEYNQLLVTRMGRPVQTAEEQTLE